MVGGLEPTRGMPKPAGFGVRAVWLLTALAGLAGTGGRRASVDVTGTLRSLLTIEGRYIILRA